MSLSGKYRLVIWQPTKYRDAKSKYLPVCYCNEHCIPFGALAYMEECKWYFEVDGKRVTRQQVVEIFRDVPQYNYKTKKLEHLTKIPGYRRSPRTNIEPEIKPTSPESNKIAKPVSTPKKSTSVKKVNTKPASDKAKKKVIPIIPMKLNASNKAVGKILCLETGEKFDRQADAARKYGIDSAQVSDSIKTGRPRSGYTFKRI